MMKRFVEKLAFQATCDCCGEPGTHMVKVLIVCRVCMNEMLMQICDAMKGE